MHPFPATIQLFPWCFSRNFYKIQMSVRYCCTRSWWSMIIFNSISKLTSRRTTSMKSMNSHRIDIHQKRAISDRCLQKINFRKYIMNERGTLTPKPVVMLRQVIAKENTVNDVRSVCDGKHLIQTISHPSITTGTGKLFRGSKHSCLEVAVYDCSVKESIEESGYAVSVNHANRGHQEIGLVLPENFQNIG